MKPYTIKKLNDYTYQIAEVYHLPAALPMYLILGNQKAALIDTGCGIGDLRGTVEEITKLPVAVYNTHFHIDHSAANSQFDEVYMHPAEEKNARGDLPKDNRLEFVELKCMYDPETDELLAYARNHMLEYDPNYTIKYIHDGDIIDLGGVKLEVIGVPGHTEGSLVFVDRLSKNAFCGDTVNPRISIAPMGGPTTLEQWAYGVDRMLDLTKDIERYFMGHRLFSFNREDVMDLRICAQEILDGAPGEPFPFIVSRQKPPFGWIHWYNGKRIVYGKNNIR